MLELLLNFTKSYSLGMFQNYKALDSEVLNVLLDIPNFLKIDRKVLRKLLECAFDLQMREYAWKFEVKIKDLSNKTVEEKKCYFRI